MNNKEEIKKRCIEFVDNKINQLNKAIEETQQSANNETKSSAGDKHETSRAMAQLESERLAKQKNQLIKSKEALISIPLEKTSVVNLGSLTKTTAGYFYMSIGLGKIDFNEEEIFVIPLHSPVGKLLTGKKVGDSFLFNGTKSEILEIY